MSRVAVVTWQNTASICFVLITVPVGACWFIINARTVITTLNNGLINPWWVKQLKKHFQANLRWNDWMQIASTSNCPCAACSWDGSGYVIIRLKLKKQKNKKHVLVWCWLFTTLVYCFHGRIYRSVNCMIVLYSVWHMKIGATCFSLSKVSLSKSSSQNLCLKKLWSP